MPLKITVQPIDLWDEKTESFISIKNPVTLSLEHSLVSMSKWEAKWKKPFLSNRQMSNEEMLDYIRCMTLTQNVNPNVYYGLREDNLKAISDYLEDPMTATTFNDGKSASNTYRNRRITSEEIYYLMFSNNIPLDFQKWHLNRLLTLIKVFGTKNTPPKKMSKSEMISNYAAINRANKAKFHTKG